MSEAGDGFLVRSLAQTYPDAFLLAEHHHPWGQLVYGRTGAMRVQAGGQAWLTPATRADLAAAALTADAAVSPGAARAAPGDTL